PAAGGGASGRQQRRQDAGPPRCERVSADEPTFARGAWAPTVGAGSVCLCRSTASVRKGFSRRAHIRPRGGGSYSRGQDQSVFVGAPHRCERVSAGKPTFAPEAGAPTVGGQGQSAFVGAPPRCERVSADEPAFAPGAGAPTIRRASVGAPPGRDRLGAMRCQPAGRPAAKALEVILDESVGY